ncbi:MAG: TonB-dependent receptor plug domain-containing protein [Cyclobacteriaceae bacterium]|nr:TonB-dependent receptor plug domain-containing protein [Cyclobacteriaceae bacterium]
MRLIAPFFLFSVACLAQSSDTIRQLNEVTIRALASDRPVFEIPAAVGVVAPAEFERTAPASLVNGLNTVAGVRMEERSPGSYRLAIRGSALRSPFGVRNVKVYFNGLPLTDGGGNTYLNLLDVETIQQAHVIKGPGSSLYGAGTGGVLLLDQPRRASAYQVGVTAGSYGLWRWRGELPVFIGKTSSTLTLSQQQSDGYRDHTALNRLTLQARSTTAVDTQAELSFFLFHARLFYETPGGLTPTQYQSNPRQARPGTPARPGAEAQNARVANTTSYLGLGYTRDWNERWHTRIGLMGARTDFVNYAILNVEDRDEKNAALRIENTYSFGKTAQHRWVSGGEAQFLITALNQFENNLGIKGAQAFEDRLASRAALLFSQMEWQLPANISLTAGASLQWQQYGFERLQPERVRNTRIFDPVISPRLSLGKKITPGIFVFANLSDGFSTPTLAEVRPSTSQYNSTLAPERGLQGEVGAKLQSHSQRWQAALTGYQLRLRNAIVTQRDENGAEFFVNAGKTDQPGLEASVQWLPYGPRYEGQPYFSARAVYAYQPYRFRAYVADGVDVSGNALTGVPEHTALFLVDGTVAKRWQLFFTGQHNARIPLNDANTQQASAFWVFHVKSSYRWLIHRATVETFAGIDNLLDRTYSLGDDINAAGDRYFNVAPGRLYYAGLKLALPHQK